MIIKLLPALGLALGLALAAACLAACQPGISTEQAATHAAAAYITVLPSTPMHYPTLPPEWTPTRTPAATPTSPPPTHTATPAAPYSQRLAAAQADINQALAAMNKGQWVAAIPFWTKVIERVPEYADAYFQRTRCILNGTPAVGVESDYAAIVHLALADINQALMLDGRNGTYFYERQLVYEALSGLELYRVDQDYWAGLALADAQAAVRFGTTVQYADHQVAYRLIDAGHAQEALDAFGKLAPLPGTTLKTDPGLQEGLAESNFALGFVDEALTHIDLAIQARPGDALNRERAIYLISLGRLPEALVVLNHSVGANPFFCGCRYYLRALIEYQQGKPALAQADIDFGTAQTWERGGLRSYVLGLLALDKGDQAGGAALLQEAQASLSRQYGPVLLKQIQARLDKLNVSRLDPTAYAPRAATPMPTPP